MNLRRTTISALVMCLLIVATIGCGTTEPVEKADTDDLVRTAVAATYTAQANTQATIDDAAREATAAQASTQATRAADAQATSAAHARTQATVDTAVQATASAQKYHEAAIDSAVQATLAALPTPTPYAETVTMSEAELAALIDQAVTMAVAATQASAAAATQAVADDAVTPEEAIAVAVALAGAEEAITYTNDLISAYYDLYAELATETIGTLQAVEETLTVMAENSAAINATLGEINTVLQEGLALAEETITQLEAAAQDAQTTAAEAQSQVDGLVETLQTELENRATAALSVQPNSIANDRQAAYQSALDFLGAVRQSLNDDKISAAELANIAQLGANASASLEAQGGPQLQQFAGSIDNITALIARGDVAQVIALMETLETSLAAVPPIPSRPSRR